MRVLVTGGAGYIGSHTVVKLYEAGHEVVIVDDLSNSKRSVLPRLASLVGSEVPLHVFDLADREQLTRVFADERPEAVIHFAGFKAVGESVAQPLSYYRNNLGSTFTLVEVMAEAGVKQLVFSSSATVYGADAPVPMLESFPTSATNPYGWTKVMIEQVLRDVAAADGSWRIALLRYFNPVGAHPSGTIGEDPSGIPNNLMPFVAQVAVGSQPKIRVFGTDYDTPDGTGVRDFIHVDDLAAGHVAALDTIGQVVDPVSTWNLGTGRGTSVLQLVSAFEKACGRELPKEFLDRRPGDIAASYADPDKAQTELNWQATRTIEDMCADEWRWRSGNPNGYPD